MPIGAAGMPCGGIPGIGAPPCGGICCGAICGCGICGMFDCGGGCAMFIRVCVMAFRLPFAAGFRYGLGMLGSLLFKRIVVPQMVLEPFANLAFDPILVSQQANDRIFIAP